MTEPRSTFKRPPEKMVQSFRIDMIGDDTIETFLSNGFSLAICCKNCPRQVEWTPLELERHYGSRLGLRIADIANRLTCSGDDGCGSHRIAVFPHLYDGEWVWDPPGS